MRLGILLNWRQALLTTVLILVMYTPNSSQCEAGLWIEQGRYPPTSVSIVLIKRKTPNWLLGLKAIARRWQVNRKVFVRAICRLLGMTLLRNENLISVPFTRVGEWESGRAGGVSCANKLAYEANGKRPNPPTHLSQTYPKGKVI